MSSALTNRIVHSTRLGHPRTRQVWFGVLLVMLLVCLVATVTRLSPLPLIPLPALAVAGYGLHRLKGAPNDRALLTWTGVLLGGALLGLWLISIAGRILD